MVLVGQMGGNSGGVDAADSRPVIGRVGSAVVPQESGDSGQEGRLRESNSGSGRRVLSDQGIGWMCWPYCTHLKLGTYHAKVVREGGGAEVSE